MVPPSPTSPARSLSLLVLAYGAATLAGQVLILREILVLAQGQELKLALGLWCWLLWTGLGSLLGGWLATRHPAGPATLAGLLAWLAWLLPGTLLAARALPTLAPQALGAALGVCLLQFFLMGQVAALTLGLGAGFCLILAAWALAPPSGLPGRLALGASLLVLGASLVFSPQLEHFSRNLQWPGRKVAAAVDSPYALLSATREADQISFYVNRVWHFTYPDPYSAEMAVQLGLLQHPQPRKILLLGGGAAGLIPEALKTKGISRIDYVELDPDLVRLVQRLLPGTEALQGRDPRVHLIFQDARRFLSQETGRYDVILMILPVPGSAQLFRYYTREFFAAVARRLEAKGVFSFTVTGGEAGLNPLRARYLAIIYHTLKQVFPEVVVFPGERVRFFASPTPDLLVRDPKILTERLAARGIKLRYVRDYYLLADLSVPRQEYVRQLLEQQPSEINTDLNPQSYLYDLILTGAREGLPLPKILLELKGFPPGGHGPGKRLGGAPGGSGAGHCWSIGRLPGRVGFAGPASGCGPAGPGRLCLPAPRTYATGFLPGYPF
ncbi:MAG: fused MFS/spermidine synthase [Syntrophobacterales bacterium]